MVFVVQRLEGEASFASLMQHGGEEVARCPRTMFQLCGVEEKSTTPAALPWRSEGHAVSWVTGRHVCFPWGSARKDSSLPCSRAWGCSAYITRPCTPGSFHRTRVLITEVPGPGYHLCWRPVSILLCALGNVLALGSVYFLIGKRNELD